MRTFIDVAVAYIPGAWLVVSVAAALALGRVFALKSGAPLKATATAPLTEPESVLPGADRRLQRVTAG